MKWHSCPRVYKALPGYDMILPVSAKGVAKLDEGCHAFIIRQVCAPKSPCGCSRLRPGRDLKGGSMWALGKRSSGWRPDGNCTEPSADGAGCLRPRKQIVEISLNDSLMVFVWQVKGLMDGNQGLEAERELQGRGQWEAVRSRCHMLLEFWASAWGPAFEQNLRTWVRWGARGRYMRTWAGKGRKVGEKQNRPRLGPEEQPFPETLTPHPSPPSCCGGEDVLSSAPAAVSFLQFL